MKLSRRDFWIAAGALALGAITSAETCHAQGALASSPIALDVGDLEDQLKVGLRPRLPQEYAFLRTVVVLVQTEQLPLQLVMETFNWARKKKRYQMVYFEAALRKRAAEAGVSL